MLTCNLVIFTIVIIRYSLSWCSYLIPGVVEHLSLLLHERRRLGEEAHADCLDVLQVHHVDVLGGRQPELLHLLNLLFALALLLALPGVEFDQIGCLACQLWKLRWVNKVLCLA